MKGRDGTGENDEGKESAREGGEGGQENETEEAAGGNAGREGRGKGGEGRNSKRTRSAGGKSASKAKNVKNIGAVSGSIERTRTYNSGRVTDGTVNRFMPSVVAYNQRNNPDFPNIYYVDVSGELRLGIASSATGREPGRDGGLIRTVVVKDAETGKTVTNTLSGYGYGGTNLPSQYDRNNLLALPDG
ncbi:hypothetical protein, partial [Pseudomonas syringae]|uniref:hypothetical protein n=1 Tax=Pseudomonas syringae TaxID=317 RepID=UPI001CA5527D